MQSTEKLAKLISQKHQTLVQLCEVGRRQMEFVKQGEIAALLKILAAKQHLINALQQVEQELHPFREEDPEQRAWPSDDARARCAEQAAQCNQLLGEVLRMEKQSEEKMTLRRNEVASQLQQVHSADQARQAYEANRYSRPSEKEAIEYEKQ